MRETEEAEQLQTSPGAVAAGLAQPAGLEGESLHCPWPAAFLCPVRAPQDGLVALEPVRGQRQRRSERLMWPHPAALKLTWQLEDPACPPSALCLMRKSFLWHRQLRTTSIHHCIIDKSLCESS